MGMAEGQRRFVQTGRPLSELLPGGSELQIYRDLILSNLAVRFDCRERSSSCRESSSSCLADVQNYKNDYMKRALAVPPSTTQEVSMRVVGVLFSDAIHTLPLQIHLFTTCRLRNQFAALKQKRARPPCTFLTPYSIMVICA